MQRPFAHACCWTRRALALVSACAADAAACCRRTGRTERCLATHARPTWSSQRPEGLYCPPGDFYIDPWRPVDRAVITHAHADHARARPRRTTWPPRRPKACCARGWATSRCRRWPTARRSTTTACACRCTRPATCSARRRCASSTAARSGWPRATTSSAARGDDNRTCAPFEPVRCDCFITEIDLRPADLPLARRSARCSPTSTPGGAPTPTPAAPACCWATASARRSASWPASTPSIGPIVVHGAVEPLNRAYRAAGVALPATQLVDRRRPTRPSLQRALVVAPPSAQGSAVDASASATTATPSPAAGCSCAARAGAAASTAASCCRDHADWPGLQRAIAATGAAARHRHPRLRAGDGALAARAGPAGRRVSTPSTATSAVDEPAAAPQAGAEPAAHEALRRACSPSSTRTTATNAKVEALQRYFAAGAAGRRGLGGLLPGRRQAAPGGADRACCARWPCEARRHPRLAVRGVLPGRRRPRRDHRPRAAAAARRAATCGLADWVEQRLLPLRGLPPERAGRAHRARGWDELDAPGRFLLIKLIGGGFRVGVSKLLVQRALAAHAGLDAKLRRAAHDGLHRRAARRPTPQRYARAAGAATRERGADAGQPYPFFLAHPLDAPPAEFDARLGPPADWLVEWKYDGIRAPARQARRPGLALVARRGAGDRALSRDRGRWRRRCPTAPCSTARSLVWRRTARPAPFALLQQRIGRKTLTQEGAAPTRRSRFIAYDLLEAGRATTCATQPQHERRARLEAAAAAARALQLSPLVHGADWAGARRAARRVARSAASRASC